MTSLAVAFSGAIVPGPLLTATIAESSKKGFIAGPVIVLGHGLLEVAMMVLLVLGLRPFFQQPAVVRTIAIAGGVFLLLMSVSMMKAILSGGISLPKAGHDGVKGFPLLTGVTFSLSNPYWTIWWATIGATYVLVSLKLGVIGLIAFFIGHILADLTWYSTVAFAVDVGKKFISDRLYRGMIAACSLFLAGLAISFILGLKVI